MKTILKGLIVGCCAKPHRLANAPADQVIVGAPTRGIVMRGMLEIAAHPRQPNERDGAPAPCRSGARGSRPRARHGRERSAGERLLLCDLKRLRPVLASYLVGSRL